MTMTAPSSLRTGDPGGTAALINRLGPADGGSGTDEGTANMDILVTESRGGIATEAAAELEAAGHRVHRCHAPSAPAFPCAGLVSGCPLENGTIDLVVAARDHVRPTPTASEDGVTCGLRRGIPVAVLGQPLMNPFEPFGAIAVTGDLVSECERIASSRRVGYEEVALATVHEALAHEDQPTDQAAVSVERINGRLRVRVLVPVEVPDRVRQHLAVRVVGRLREHARHVAGIDIGVADLENFAEADDTADSSASGYHRS